MFPLFFLIDVIQCDPNQDLGYYFDPDSLSCLLCPEAPGGYSFKILLAPTVVIVLVLIVLGLIVLMIYCGCLKSLERQHSSSKIIFDNICESLRILKAKELSNEDAVSKLFNAERQGEIESKDEYSIDNKSTRFGVLRTW